METAFTTFTAGLGLTALIVSGTAGATQHLAKPSQKEESIGVLSGVVIGAVAGGPLGAIAGMALGGWLGNRFDAHKQKMAILDERLQDSDQTVAALSAELRNSQERIASLSEELRTQPLAPSVQRTIRDDVLFRTNDSTLNGETEARLTELAQVLAGVPDVIIKLDSYADIRGTEGQNLVLSGQRAEAVRAALLAGGVGSDRILMTAHGEKDATGTTGDIDGYALDRRVVITLESTHAQVARREGN